MTISTTKFEDVPRPSVIVCPQDQFYPRELNKTGYYPIFHLFGGLHNKVSLSNEGIDCNLKHNKDDNIHKSAAWKR